MECIYFNGIYICELEIDLDIGDVVIQNYVIVDDFGVIVNLFLLVG